MTMQTIQLDISSDVFDKVMSFLEILPKKKESLSNFFQSSPLVGLSLERD